MIGEVIGEVIGTVVTLGWALAAWIAAAALVVAVVLHSLAAAAWWAWRTVRRGVVGPGRALNARLAAEQPAAVPESPGAAHGRSAPPPRPSWARTDKEAA